MKDFNLTKDQNEKMGKIQQQIATHHFAMDYHADRALSLNKDLWATLMKLFPEANPEKYRYSFNSEEPKVFCLGIKSE